MFRWMRTPRPASLWLTRRLPAARRSSWANGGTSLATPLWAGVVALADQVRANASLSTLDGPSQTLPRLYQLPASDFSDVTTGNNGFSAGPGYDLVTGIGTPVANLLVPDLAGVSVAPGPSVTLSIQGNPISENGGRATITATLSATTTEAVTVDLTFSGTAVLGTQYSVSSNEIIIPAGQTTGSITVTGINTNQNTGNQTIIATASSIQGGTRPAVLNRLPWLSSKINPRRSR